MADITTVSTFTKIFSTVFGNKRIWDGELTLGSGEWADAGVALSASDFGMDTIEAIICDSDDIVFSWNGSVLKGYTGAATTGADKIMVSAIGATVNTNLHVLVIGTGGSDI